MYIYKITNLINGKAYIGQTINNISARFREHCKPSRTGVSAISKALEKYGKENFTLELLYTASNIQELNDKEQEFIRSTKSMAPNGYNLTTGGYNFLNSAETKEKKRQASLGHCVSEETKLKIGLANSGTQARLHVYTAKLARLMRNLFDVNGTGVRFQARDNTFQAFMHVDSKIITKTFSVNKYGEVAREMAVNARRQFEQSCIEYLTFRIGECNG